MKIVYISNSIIPSRTANSIQVMKMCQAFSKNGNQVWLIAPKRDREIETGVINVYDFYSVKNCFKIQKVPYIYPENSRLSYHLSATTFALSVMKEIIKVKPDIVYGREILSCTVAALAGYRAIFEAHGPIWLALRGSAAFKILHRCRRFEKLIVISNALKNEYLNRYRFDPDKIMVAHDGADPVDNFNSCTSWPGRAGALKLGYIGHLYQGKGMEIVCELALQKDEVDFHVIGGMEKDIAFWKDRVKSDNIFFHGYVQQNRISRCINTLDICLLPNQKTILTYGYNDKSSRNISNYTSPLKLFEYMAHKKPIIASDLPSLREILNESNSILVKHDDIKEWKAAVNRLKSNALQKKIGERAFKDFFSNYTWDIRAKNVLP